MVGKLTKYPPSSSNNKNELWMMKTSSVRIIQGKNCVQYLLLNNRESSRAFLDGDRGEGFNAEAERIFESKENS